MAAVRHGLKDVADLKEKLSALLDCLVYAGVLTTAQFNAQVHRRRFEDAWRRQPCAWEHTFVDVAGVGEMATTLLHHAGLAALIELRATSADFRRVVPAARLRELTVSRLYVCGGDCHGHCLFSMECLDPDGGTWEALTPMQRARSSAAAAVSGGLLYVCGGHDGLRVLDSVECFCPLMQEWTELPRMLQPRQSAAMATLGGRLYVLGGNDGDNICRSCESFNCYTRYWGMLPDMYERRHGSAAAAISFPEDGRGVYVCGGNDGLQSLRSVSRFNPHLNAWQHIPQMSDERERFAAAAMHGYVYVCGGGYAQAHVLNTVERFNPTTNVWEGIPPMPQVRLGLAAAAVSGKLFVCGGSYGRQDLRTVERYDPRAGSWEPLPQMTTPRNLATVVALRVCVAEWLP